MDDRELVTISKAARIAGVARRTIYNWLERGSIEYIRIPSGRRRINVDALVKLGYVKSLSRAEIVQVLAEVSHRTYMRQKAKDLGLRPENMDAKVTDHDRERAEDIVSELVRLKLLRRLL